MFFFLSSISLWVPPQPRHYFSFCVLAVPQTKYLHGPIRTRAEYWELRYHSDSTSSVVLASSFVSVALVHSPNTSCKILTAGVDASSSSYTRLWAPCTAVTKQKRGVTCKSLVYKKQQSENRLKTIISSRERVPVDGDIPSWWNSWAHCFYHLVLPRNKGSSNNKLQCDLRSRFR